MTDTFTRKSFWAELETLGEESVRVRIMTGAYAPKSAKRQLAEEWIRKKDQERADDLEARKLASQSEQIDIARDAKDAAWAAADAARDAAREAKKANIIATLALIAAIPAIAISLIALFLRR